MEFKQKCILFLLTVLLIVCCNDSEKSKTEHETKISDSYVLVKDWPDLPDDFTLGNPTGLGIDSNNNLVVFHRASRVWVDTIPEDKIQENTIFTLDKKTGKILKSWGTDLFVMPHGLEVDNLDNIWVTDCGLHQVLKFDSEGKLLMTLGEAQISGDDSTHFNEPTDVAVAEDGSFYVSDGYENSRIVKFSKDGEYLFEWGTFGDNQGEFNIPHGIDLDKNGYVYVADRENNRIQKFDSMGNFITLWQNRTTDQLYSVTVDNQRDHLFGIDYMIVNDTIIKGSDIFRFDLDVNLKTQFGRTKFYDGPISRYHDIQIDDDGSIYVGDILGNKVQKFILK